MQAQYLQDSDQLEIWKLRSNLKTCLSYKIFVSISVGVSVLNVREMAITEGNSCLFHNFKPSLNESIRNV